MTDEVSSPVDAREIGLLVSMLRDKAGITTTELAGRVGISQAQISRLENGKHGFRSSTLAKIASALGYDARVVFAPKAPAAPAEDASPL